MTEPERVDSNFLTFDVVGVAFDEMSFVAHRHDRLSDQKCSQVRIPDNKRQILRAQSLDELDI